MLWEFRIWFFQEPFIHQLEKRSLIIAAVSYPLSVAVSFWLPRWEKASRSPESISLSTTKHRLLHTLSARRASFLAAAIIFFLQRQFGHTGRAFCLRGACLLSNEDHLVLNCSSKPSAVEAGFKMRGSFKISAANRSVSILLMDLKKTVSLALIFR